MHEVSDIKYHVLCISTMQLLYQNIAISGEAGTGKGTLLEGLRSYLTPLGWRFASGGQLIRDQSGEQVVVICDKVSDDFNNFVEKRTEDLFVKEKHYVIEAWLAGWVARTMDDTLRVLLVCSDPDVLTERVAARDHVTPQEAKSIMQQRSDGNDRNWRRIYGDHDFMDPSMFHLVIDTFDKRKEDIVQIVLDKLGYQSPPHQP